jgi:hypothetical protein
MGRGWIRGSPWTGRLAYVISYLEHRQGEKWDQFAVNEQKFGISTDYEESMYTTVVDRSAADFKKKEAEAARIAKEIEMGVTNNPHLAEERGQKPQGEVDEETLYDTVPNLRIDILLSSEMKIKIEITIKGRLIYDALSLPMCQFVRHQSVRLVTNMAALLVEEHIKKICSPSHLHQVRSLPSLSNFQSTVYST